MVYLDSLELASSILINIIKKDPDYNYWSIGISSNPSELHLNNYLNGKNIVVYEAITSEIANNASSLLLRTYSMEKCRLSDDTEGRFVYVYRNSLEINDV